jgi:hypothetical protein
MSTKYSASALFTFLSPTVIKVRIEGSPMFPSVRLAQNWLETGGTIPDWNNLGGIKVGSGKPNAYWTGASVNASTHEYVNGNMINTNANFRAYSSVYNFYKDQDLLFGNSRYQPVREAKTPQDQCTALYAAGYATDPNYASKLMSIITQYNLTTYDQQAEQEEQEMAQLADLETRVAAMEQKLNMSGKVAPPAWAQQAITAGQAVKAITTSADKSYSEFVALQMLYNIGLLDENVLTAIQKLKTTK